MPVALFLNWEPPPGQAGPPWGRWCGLVAVAGKWVGAAPALLLPLINVRMLSIAADEELPKQSCLEEQEELPAFGRDPADARGGRYSAANLHRWLSDKQLDSYIPASQSLGSTFCGRDHLDLACFLAPCGSMEQALGSGCHSVCWSSSSASEGWFVRCGFAVYAVFVGDSSHPPPHAL